MSLISLNQLNMALNAIKQKIKGSRGNWEQNDSTADDYIKNRPFYTDGDTVHQIDKKYVPMLDGVVIEDNLAAVAFSGDYNSLINKPALVDVATSGSYNDLSDAPDIPEEQIQSNLFETNTDSKSYVKGVIRQESLPAGYPYVTYEAGKQVSFTKPHTVEFIEDDNGNPTSNSWYSVDIEDLIDGDKYCLKLEDNMRIMTYCDYGDSRYFLFEDGEKFGSFDEWNGRIEYKAEDLITLFNIGVGTYEFGIYYAVPIYQPIIEEYLPDSVATTTDIEELRDLIGDTSVSDQITSAYVDEVYVQAEEPVDAPIGSIWVDTDAEGTGALTTGMVPAVTADDNDKLIQVVNGEYTLVTVENSSIKTYIDNYINEALGGDY